MKDISHSKNPNNTTDLRQQHYSTIIFKGYLRYLSGRHNRAFLAKKVQESIGLPIEYFESDRNWVSSIVCDRFVDLVGEIESNPAEADFNGGKQSLASLDGSLLTLVTKSLVTLHQALGVTERLMKFINRYDEYVVLVNSPRLFRFRIRTPRHPRYLKRLAENGAGFFCGAAIIFGHREPKITYELIDDHTYEMQVIWRDRIWRGIPMGHVLSALLFVATLTASALWLKGLTGWAVAGFAAVAISAIALYYRANRLRRLDSDLLFETIESSDQRYADLYQQNQTITELYKKANELTEKLITTQDQLIAAERIAATAKVATQVAHDIRSPLASLELVVESLRTQIKASEYHILKSAANRMREIAADLLKKPSQSKPEDSTLPIRFLVQQIVDEKKIQTDFQFVITGGLHRFSISDPILKRMLANLIQNSIDASPHSKKQIEIQIDPDGISIQDYGKGIPAEQIHKMGQLGFSYDKRDGNGLGLHHVIQTLNNHGLAPKIEEMIQSTVGQGTQIRLNLGKPLPAPSWLTAEPPHLNPDLNPSIHHIVWVGPEEFVSAIQDSLGPTSQIKISHATSILQVRNQYRDHFEHLESTHFYFSDADDHYRQLAFDAIQELGLGDKSLLIGNSAPHPDLIPLLVRTNLRWCPGLG